MLVEVILMVRTQHSHLFLRRFVISLLSAAACGVFLLNFADGPYVIETAACGAVLDFIAVFWLLWGTDKKLRRH